MLEKNGWLATSNIPKKKPVKPVEMIIIANKTCLSIFFVIYLSDYASFLTQSLSKQHYGHTVVGVVAPTVPFIFIEAVPVRFVTVPLNGVPNAPPE